MRHLPSSQIVLVGNGSRLLETWSCSCCICVAGLQRWLLTEGWGQRSQWELHPSCLSCCVEVWLLGTASWTLKDPSVGTSCPVLLNSSFSVQVFIFIFKNIFWYVFQDWPSSQEQLFSNSGFFSLADSPYWGSENNVSVWQNLQSLLPVTLHFIPLSFFRSLPIRRLVACPASLCDKQFELQPWE